MATICVGLGIGEVSVRVLGRHLGDAQTILDCRQLAPADGHVNARQGRFIEKLYCSAAVYVACLHKSSWLMLWKFEDLDTQMQKENRRTLLVECQEKRLNVASTCSSTTRRFRLVAPT